MTDDIAATDTPPDSWMPDNPAHDVRVGEDQLFGGSIVPDINHPGAGWNVYEGGDLLFNILKSNVTPGGFDIHKLGTSGTDADDMGSIMETLAFSPDDIRLPWSHGSDDADATPLVGTPEHDAQYWQPQTTAFTCAVQAQRGIIEEFTGQTVSEAQLVYDATVNGWLTDGGMSPHDVGNLLDLYGIPCHGRTGATVEELMTELAQGRKVIVGIDSGEAWQTDFPLEDFFSQSADHAIWVTGVDMSDPAHPKVIVNDSGDSSGAGKAYDLALFKDAWEDSGFFYVATDDAPSNTALAANQGSDQASVACSDLSAYFGKFYSYFREHLQERIDDQSPVAPSDVPSIFTDAAVRAFVANMPKSPMASLNDSTTDSLFRVI